MFNPFGKQEQKEPTPVVEQKPVGAATVMQDDPLDPFDQPETVNG